MLIPVVLLYGPHPGRFLIFLTYNAFRITAQENKVNQNMHQKMRIADLINQMKPQT